MIPEQYHFHKWKQASGESISEYIAELRCLAAKCSFNGYLDNALLNPGLYAGGVEGVQTNPLYVITHT